MSINQEANDINGVSLEIEQRLLTLFRSEDELNVAAFIGIHTILSSFIMVLLTLLQEKYKDENRSPFEIHPAIMLLFLVAASIYTLALVSVIIVLVNKLDTNYLPILKHVSLVFGTLSCGPLLLLFYPVLGYVVIVLSVLLLLAKALFESRQLILQMLYHLVTLASQVTTQLYNTIHVWFLLVHTAIQGFDVLFFYNWLNHAFQLMFLHKSIAQQGAGAESEGGPQKSSCNIQMVSESDDGHQP